MPYQFFEELEVYQLAREFRKEIYLLIKKLPVEEKFNLAGQMRRAATSLTNNIAEGHGRYHYQENIQFCRQSRGSLMELIDDLKDYQRLEELIEDLEDTIDLLRAEREAISLN